MTDVTWFEDNPEKQSEEPPPKILGCRRAEHTDILSLERLIRTKTHDIFGDIDLGRIYEKSCLSLVQYNEKYDVISGMFLCNYPNVPSVSPDSWLSWLKMLYGIDNVTERNALFMHFLVWEQRYVGRFYENLLTGLFDVASDCQHVILVFPPQVTPVDIFERQMIRIFPKEIKNTESVQSLYISVRHLRNPRLKIRRVVEEDNDDVVQIIDAESSLLKETYGEYYVSEMTRYPDGDRELIVSEDTDGIATGVVCLNRMLDIDVLNENFELRPYNGLRKTHQDDEIPLEDVKPTSEIFFSIFRKKSWEYAIDRENCSEVCTASLENVFVDEEESFSEKTQGEVEESMLDEGFKTDEIPKETNANNNSNDAQDSKEDPEIKVEHRKDSMKSSNAKSRSSTVEANNVHITEPELSESIDNLLLREKSLEDSKINFLGDLPSISDYFNTYHQSKLHTSVFADSLFDIPQRSSVVASKVFATSQIFPSEEMDDNLSYPTYHGDANAFALEILATRKEIENRWLRNFLEAAFECFPDLDYCVILLPFSHPYFPFLNHFVRVPLRSNKDFPMTLYVTHRAVHLGEIKSYKGEVYYRNSLQELLRSVPKKERILHDFDEATEKNHKDLHSCIFTCDETIIGLAIIRAENRLSFLKRRYHMEDYISMENISKEKYGRILHFILMPVFAVHQRFFLREVMRNCGFTVLLYRLYESDASALTRWQPLATCLNSMIPVRPRRKIEYKFRGCVETDTMEITNGLEKDGRIFSLFLTTPRFTSIPISIVDFKIVVIGASDCGVACAEYLALESKRESLYFANITVVSPNGFPFESEHSNMESRMIVFKGRYCHEYRTLVAARTWINVVYGKVIAINRKEKYVTVMNQGNLTYDYLILTCGLQYQRPSFEEETDTQRRGEPIEREVPWNCLTINDDTEAFFSLEKILFLTKKLTEKKSIVFYGRNIDCYCALQGLFEFGVKGSWITLIEPPLNLCESHNNVFFNDCEVDKEVMNGIVRNEVNILFGWSLVNWTTTESEKGEIIESLTLEAKGETKIIPCDALFNFREKTIDIAIFLAICRAGLVFDGQLVVDPECRTNDPFIFAAGTITKYSRKFYSESLQHKYYNSIEVGERLAKILRKVVDVHEDNGETSFAASRKKVHSMPPVLRTPTIVACVLPGGYHYLHVRKPGKMILRKIAILHDFYGEVMVTGSCKSEIGYFRLRLNLCNCVETVTCFSKQNFEVHHMISLYGKHESLLNELKIRFHNSLISDFYSYFREPWAIAIFCDRFECLRVENRAILLSKMNFHGDSLIDDCIEASVQSKTETITKEDRQLIQSRYVDSIYQQELEENLIEFLQFLEDELPTYCTPRKLREMYADIGKSPLYTDL